MSRRLQVNETMDKCSRMLREVTSDDIDEVKYKLEAIRSQADLVSKLSSDRLTMLEEALPLATHFSLTHGDLQGWLAEIEADIDTVDTMPGSAIDQIKKQQDLVKASNLSYLSAVSLTHCNIVKTNNLSCPSVMSLLHY